MEIRVIPKIPPKAAYLFSFDDIYSFDEPENAVEWIRYLIGLGIPTLVETKPGLQEIT